MCNELRLGITSLSTYTSVSGNVLFEKMVYLILTERNRTVYLYFIKKIDLVVTTRQGIYE